jgi:hypothetical protein
LFANSEETSFFVFTSARDVLARGSGATSVRAASHGVFARFNVKLKSLIGRNAREFHAQFLENGGDPAFVVLRHELMVIRPKCLSHCAFHTSIGLPKVTMSVCALIGATSVPVGH